MNEKLLNALTPEALREKKCIEYLDAMIKSDIVLYEHITDAPGFASYFGQLVLLARTPDADLHQKLASVSI